MSSVITAGRPGFLGPPFPHDWIFESLARDAESWFGKARALRLSAASVFGLYRHGPRIVAPHLVASRMPGNLHDVLTFLNASAIENLLKGIIVQIDPTAVAGGRLDWKGSGHDLVALAGRADVTLGEDEREVLALGTEALASFGRFPVPMNAKGLIQGHASSEPHVQNVFDRLFDLWAARLLRLVFSARGGHGYTATDATGAAATVDLPPPPWTA